MMKNFLWILMLSSVILNGTTGSVINLTNASSSLEDANNMSAIEGTVNQTA